MNGILITVVTICRDNPKELIDTINSYYKFIDDSIEGIIVDGSDSDCCFNVMQSYSGVHYIKQSSKGIYSAMNEGVHKARGLSIIFMNAGDLFYAGFDISDFSKKYHRDLYDKIIFGDSIVSYGKYKKTNTHDGIVNGIDKFWLSHLPTHQSIFCPTSFVKNHPFDVNKVVSSDSELLINAFNQLDYIYINQIVCNFSLGGISSKPTKLKTTLNHCKEIIETRSINKKSHKLKLIARQVLKLYLIKLIGYELYLRIMG